MFLFFFSFGLLCANIFFFAKKKYLNLFIPCLLFLPSYYGIEFSKSLPLLTVTRIMFIVFYIYTYINKRRSLTIKYTSLSAIPKELFFLAGYFVFRLVANLFYFAKYSASIKTVLELILEQLMLLIAVYLLAPTNEEIVSLLKSIVLSANALFITGVFESLTGFRPFDSLYTVSREMLNDHYIRLGLLRATTTLGLANFYGNMCVLILPLILDLYEKTLKKSYLAIVFFDLLAIIHSGCRSDMFFFILIIFVYSIYVLRRNERLISFVIASIVTLVCLTITITLLSLANPSYAYYYIGSATSMLNAVGFNFDIDSSAPDGIEGYGVNANATRSRIRQFSGIYYVARINILFGLGSDAQNRGEVRYYWNGIWQKESTYDVGIVEIFCNEGLLGIAGLVCFILFFVLDCKKTNNMFYFLCFLSFMLSTLSSTHMWYYPIIYIILYSHHFNFKKEIRNLHI